MCGYCVEELALRILREDVQGILQMKNLRGTPCHYFYLRETSDFISSMDRIRRSLAQKKQAFFDEVTHSVLLYRGLEMLINKGFDSPEYRQLLKKPLYREAVAVCCTTEIQQEFEAVSAELNISHLALLYDPETYFWKRSSRQYQLLSDLIPSCRELLKHYISWWLDGKGLRKNDLMAMMDETGVMDPIDDISEEENSRFRLLVRAIFCSILTIGKCTAGRNMLLAIVQRLPAGVPYFNGEDLWLQRIAALKLIDLEGFDIFHKNLTSIRATTYYYLDIVRGFTAGQKRMLLDEARQHPESMTTDNFISLAGWLNEGL